MTAQTITVTSTLGKDALFLRSMTLQDGLSQPFEARLELLGDKFDVDLNALVGTAMSVELNTSESGKRYVHGLVAEIEFVGTTGRFAIYAAVLRPWLWFLRYSVDCRIFQDKTVPAILKEGIFSIQGFTDYQDGLTATYPARGYCVQYCESDFDFVSRLMEEEGIYYYFKHESSKHTLHLCDSKSAHTPATGYGTVKFIPGEDAASMDKEGISDWREKHSAKSGKLVTLDFDFEKPKTDLKAQFDSTPAPKPRKFEYFDYPGKYTESSRGDTMAKARLQSLQAMATIHQARGNPRGIAVGNSFTLAEHPRSTLNKEYLVVGMAQELVSSDFEFGGTENMANYRLLSNLSLIESSVPFRPARRTPKARVSGPQTALVTGDSSAKDGPYTDKYGRIKVRFHWDRHKADPDENASCWIRVASGAAGSKWGQIFIPRVGQEVVVDFIEGDPDQPIVTGVVYNADLMPPYALPDNKTRSTIKTRSIVEATDQNFNELRFEDKKGEEEVYFHAEKDFNRVVENNDTLKVGFDKKDKGDQTIDIFNNQKITIGGSEAEDGSQTVSIFNNQSLTVGQSGAADGSQTVTVLKNRSVTLQQGDDTLNVDTGKRTATINGDCSLTVKTGNHAVTVQAGNQTVDISAGSQSIKAAQAITIESSQSITLKVGGNSIAIEQSGITIKGIMVTVEGSAKLDAKSPMTTVAGTGMLTVQGALVKIN